MGDTKIKKRNFNKLITKIEKFVTLSISKNQIKQTDFLNQQIANLSSQLNHSIAHHNICLLTFHNLERTVTEYKHLIDQQKNAFQTKLARIADHQKHIDLLRLNGPMMAARTVGPFYKLMEKDCILPE